MDLSRRRALPLMASGFLAPGFVLSGCAQSGIEVIDRSIDLPGTVLYSSDRDGAWDVIISDFNADSLLKVTGSLPGEQKHGIWGPDGETIYFSTFYSGSWRIGMITDISDASGTFTVLTGGAGQQTSPVINDAGTKLAYLDLTPTGQTPDLRIMDLATGTSTLLAANLNIKDMEFVPSSDDLIILDNKHIKVVDTSTGVVDQIQFSVEGANGFEHATFSFTAAGEIYCSGVELNRTVYALGRFDYSVLDSITRLTEGTRSNVNSWQDMHCFAIDGEDHLLISAIPSAGGFENRIAVMKVGKDQYAILFMRRMEGKNHWPDWTAVEHL